MSWEALFWTVFGYGFVVLVVAGAVANAARRVKSGQRISVRELLSKPVPGIKTQEPWADVFGVSHLELVRWAEERAVRLHYAEFPDSRLKSPLATRPLNSEQAEKLKTSFREAQATQQPMLLADDIDFSDSGEYDKFGKHLPGIGYVWAKTPEKLARACEVVLEQEYIKLETRLNQIDIQITNLIGIPASYARTRELREQRATTWAKLKVVIEMLPDLGGRG